MKKSSQTWSTGGVEYCARGSMTSADRRAADARRSEAYDELVASGEIGRGSYDPYANNPEYNLLTSYALYPGMLTYS